MTKQPVRCLFFLLTVILTMATTVCAGVKVLVIPKGSMATFWTAVGQGARQAGKDLGVTVTWRGPHTEDQHQAQVQIIQYGIQNRYDAIVLAPNHVEMTGPVQQMAIAGGIPIVLIDSGMNTRYHASIVESNNYQSGQVAADHLAALMGGKGKVVLVRHLKNHASTHQREQGFMDAIQSRYPQLEIIADPYIGASLGTAYHAMEDLIRRTPTIDGIFSVAEVATLGTLRAIEAKRLQRKIRIIGFDFNDAIKTALLDKTLDATIVQAPFQIGYMGVQTAVQLIRGKTVPRRIFTDTVLVTGQNLWTPEVKKLIGTHTNPID